MVVGGASGNPINLSDAIEQFFVGLRIFGKTTQNGTPTPDAPVELVSVGGNGSITVNVTGEHTSQNVVVSTPNGLPGIPVTSGGNHTDASGQRWICDEIDFARGVYIQRAKRIVVDGIDEIWKKSSLQSVDGATRFDVEIAGEPRAAQRFCLCDAYAGTDYVNFYVDSCWCNASQDIPHLEFRICTSHASTVEELVILLQANPVEFIYAIHAPIETPLTEEDLAAYASLHTYRNNTTVTNDAGAHMELEYVMDAKKYIDSKIAGAILSATVE